jgi:hypothetical protein
MSRSTPHISHRRVGQLRPRLESLCRTTADHPTAPAVRSGRPARHDRDRRTVVVHRVPAGAATTPAVGEARAASHGGRDRGRRRLAILVEATTSVTGHAETARGRTARGAMARLGGRPPTRRDLRVLMALRARSEPANAGRGRVPEVRGATVVRQRAIVQSRVATGTTDVAAVRRNVTLGGVIRGRFRSQTVTVLVGTTVIVQTWTAHHAHHRRAHDLGAATAYLLDGSRHPALLRRSVRSRSRLLAAFVSPDSRPRPRRGSARSGLTKDHCDPRRARPLSGRNAPSR